MSEPKRSLPEPLPGPGPEKNLVTHNDRIFPLPEEVGRFPPAVNRWLRLLQKIEGERWVAPRMYPKCPSCGFVGHWGHFSCWTDHNGRVETVCSHIPGPEQSQGCLGMLREVQWGRQDRYEKARAAVLRG